MAKKITPNAKLTADEEAEVTKSFEGIQRVFKRHNINIEHVIGLVTSKQVAAAGKQVKVKFAEETGAQMNMIAFD